MAGGRWWVVVLMACRLNLQPGGNRTVARSYFLRLWRDVCGNWATQIVAMVMLVRVWIGMY